MEETLNPEIEQAVVNEPTVEEQPKTLNEQLDELIAKRMGSFEVKIGHADLKYIKNSLNQKVEWKGPNEAYLIIMSLLSIDNVLQSLDPKERSAKVNLPASTIESINYFLTKITGKGIESAQKLFSISMIIRQPSEAIRKLDEEIEYLKKEIEKNATKVG